MNAELFAPNPTKGEQAKQRLLLAALEKIGEKGYENASVREIADVAGQNIAAISYYFGSKEKLYAAVVDGIVDYLGAAFREVATEARERLNDGSLNPETAADLLKRILRVFLVEHIERSEIAKLRNVMMREQAAPTCAFDHLFDKGIKPLHELFTRTLAVASGDDPESPQAIIRAHTLLSQVIGFTVARCTIIRRLGVEKLEKHHADMIAATLDLNVDAICAGLAKTRSSK